MKIMNIFAKKPTDIMPNMIEIIPDRLYFATARKAYQVKKSDDSHHLFSTDENLVYMSFHNDFGPLNLACVFSFIQLLKKKLKLKSMSHKKLIYYTSFFSTHGAQKRVNAAFLLGSFMISQMALTPQEVFKVLNADPSLHFLNFRDASFGPCTYNLSLLDCLNGFHKSIVHNFFHLDFDLEEYLHYERVENGDFNWIIPGLFLAFCSPQDRNDDKKVKCHPPSFYVDYFKTHGVDVVVRLNNKTYNAISFTQHSIRHVDLYFPDGSVPSEAVLDKFINLATQVQKQGKALAVHCKAGLGRTGTLIGCYLMRRYGFSSREAIAWLRIARPGSVIGPQQYFMDRMEKKYKACDLGESKKNGVNDDEFVATDVTSNDVNNVKTNFNDINNNNNFNNDNTNVNINNFNNKADYENEFKIESESMLTSSTETLTPDNDGGDDDDGDDGGGDGCDDEMGDIGLEFRGMALEVEVAWDDKEATGCDNDVESDSTYKSNNNNTNNNNNNNNNTNNNNNNSNNRIFVNRIKFDSNNNCIVNEGTDLTTKIYSLRRKSGNDEEEDDDNDNNNKKNNDKNDNNNDYSNKNSKFSLQSKFKSSKKKINTKKKDESAIKNIDTTNYHDENTPYISSLCHDNLDSQVLPQLFESCEQTQGDRLNEIKRRRNEPLKKLPTLRPQFMRKCKTITNNNNLYNNKSLFVGRENKNNNNLNNINHKNTQENNNNNNKFIKNIVNKNSNSNNNNNNNNKYISSKSSARGLINLNTKSFFNIYGGDNTFEDKLSHRIAFHSSCSNTDNTKHQNKHDKKINNTNNKNINNTNNNVNNNNKNNITINKNILDNNVVSGNSPKRKMTRGDSRQTEDLTKKCKLLSSKSLKRAIYLGGGSGDDCGSSGGNGGSSGVFGSGDGSRDGDCVGSGKGGRDGSGCDGVVVSYSRNELINRNKISSCFKVDHSNSGRKTLIKDHSKDFKIGNNTGNRGLEGVRETGKNNESGVSAKSCIGKKTCLVFPTASEGVLVDSRKTRSMMRF